jgi:hypothetical protein
MSFITKATHNLYNFNLRLIHADKDGFLTPLEAFSDIKATNYWVQYQATIPSGNYSIIFEMSASIYDNYKILKLDDIAVQPGECSEGNVICS